MSARDIGSKVTNAIDESVSPYGLAYGASRLSDVEGIFGPSFELSATRRRFDMVYEDGITFTFGLGYCNSSWQVRPYEKKRGRLRVIAFEAPFAGCTSRGIAIGSSMASVVRAYGKPLSVIDPRGDTPETAFSALRAKYEAISFLFRADYTHDSLEKCLDAPVLQIRIWG